jgi:hypothetical protein
MPGFGPVTHPGDRQVIAYGDCSLLALRPAVADGLGLGLTPGLEHRVRRVIAMQRMPTDEARNFQHKGWPSDCAGRTMKPRCTTGKQRRISRWAPHAPTLPAGADQTSRHNPGGRRHRWKRRLPGCHQRPTLQASPLPRGRPRPGRRSGQGSGSGGRPDMGLAIHRLRAALPRLPGHPAAQSARCPTDAPTSALAATA